MCQSIHKILNTKILEWFEIFPLYKQKMFVQDRFGGDTYSCSGASDNCRPSAESDMYDQYLNLITGLLFQYLMDTKTLVAFLILTKPK